MQGSQRIGLGEGVQLDPGNECLWIGGASVALRPKVYGVLRYLVDHPDRIVTKDELLDAMWSDTVVGDSVLKVCVRELRSALGDDPKAPSYIETVHRRGYRYVGQALAPESDAESNVAGPAQPPDGSFVARGAELEELSAALAAAERGQRRTVFISGPAGIGKTTLLEETIRRFSAHSDVRIVRGRCQESLGTKEPYLPFLECVNELASHPAAVQELRRMAPTWLVQYPWHIREEDRSALERELHGATQSRMLRELNAFLEETSRDRTVMLVIEDLHWGDADSLDLLSFLSTRDAPARLLLIAATRSTEERGAESSLGDVMRELVIKGQASDLPLQRLATDDIRGMLRHRFGEARVADEIAPWLHKRTEGHPLFAFHLLEHLVATAHLADGGEGWQFTASRARLAELMPASLPAILDKNLESYVGDERIVLEGASLSGYGFCVNSVADATELAVERVEDLCESIAARGRLLVADGVSELPGGVISARYRFTHALLRDALRRAIAPARRVRWQRRLAECGEAVYGDRAGEIAPGLAIHFEEARLFERAIHYHRLAAVGARRTFSSETALEHLRAAQSLLPRVDAEAGDLPRVSAQEIAQEVAQVLRSSGDVKGAAQAYESVAEAATDPATAAEAWLLAAGARSWLGRADCIACLDRATALIPSQTGDEIVAHTEGCAAYWRLLWDGWEPSGRGACERALRLAKEQERADHVLAHRARLALFMLLEGRYDEACAAAAKAHEEAIALGDASESMLAHFYRGLALLFGERQADAKAHATRARHEAAESGHTPWKILFDVQLAWVAVETDDPHALRLAEAAWKSAEPLDHEFIVAFADVVLGLAQAAKGLEADARPRLEGAGRGPFLMDWLCRLIALTGLVQLGDEEARIELRHQAEAMGAGWFLGRAEGRTA